MDSSVSAKTDTEWAACAAAALARLAPPILVRKFSRGFPRNSPIAGRLLKSCSDHLIAPPKARDAMASRGMTPPAQCRSCPQRMATIEGFGAAAWVRRSTRTRHLPRSLRSRRQT